MGNTILIQQLLPDITGIIIFPECTNNKEHMLNSIKQRESILYRAGCIPTLPLTYYIKGDNAHLLCFTDYYSQFENISFYCTGSPTTLNNNAALKVTASLLWDLLFMNV